MEEMHGARKGRDAGAQHLPRVQCAHQPRSSLNLTVAEFIALPLQPPLPPMPGGQSGGLVTWSFW